MVDSHTRSLFAIFQINFIPDYLAHLDCDKDLILFDEFIQMNTVSTRGSVLYQALVWLCSLNLVSSKLVLVTLIVYCTAVGKGFTDYYSLYCYPESVQN